MREIHQSPVNSNQTMLVYHALDHWEQTSRELDSNNTDFFYKKMNLKIHYSDVIRSVIASQITGLSKGDLPVTGGFPSQRGSNGKMFPFDYVIISICKILPMLSRPQCVD